MSNGDKYFATLPPDELASNLMKKADDYYEFLIDKNFLQLWRMAYNNYYRSIGTMGLNRAGQQGELTRFNVNQYRAFIKHILALTTSQRLAYDPIATNSDSKSQEQANLARDLLDYYCKEKKMERYLYTALEEAVGVFGEAEIAVTWNTSSGEMFGVNPETGAPIFNGDVEYKNYTPIDVIKDFTKQDANNHQWKMTRDYVNKYDLSVQYPEKKEEILALPTRVEDRRQTTLFPMIYEDFCNDVARFTLYHQPTETLPNGRMFICLSSELWLFDGPSPYRNIPLYRLAAEQMASTCFGYTVGFDLLPIQESYDILHSSIITNASTFGVQNIVTKKGGGISVNELSGGLNHIEVEDVNDIKALNLVAIPESMFQYLETVEGLYGSLTGVNSVAQGNPEASLKSGTALALVQSQAIQFLGPTQIAYVQCAEDIGLATINLLKDFAKVPRVAAIVGKANEGYLKSFTGDDLNLINRTQIDVSNPLTKTLAGKVNLADALLSKGLIKNPDEYIQVITTGRLEPMYEGTQAEAMLIRSENERLAKGEMIQAMITDAHPTHVLEHKIVASSVEARQNPQIMAALTAHMQQHIDLFKALGSDPLFAQMLGLPIPPAPPAPPPGANPQQALPPGNDVPDNTNPAVNQANTAQPPGLPKNPQTGNPWTPETGGL